MNWSTHLYSEHLFRLPPLPSLIYSPLYNLNIFLVNMSALKFLTVLMLSISHQILFLFMVGVAFGNGNRELFWKSQKFSFERKTVCCRRRSNPSATRREDVSTNITIIIYVICEVHVRVVCLGLHFALMHSHPFTRLLFYFFTNAVLLALPN